jgi:RluA family pseudouridine synthase
MELLFSDDALLVLNKPAGLPVLPDGWERDAPYLVKILEEQYGKLWIVHRLDKSTSGVMVFARTAEAHRLLNIQFEGHAVRKIYHAIVEGGPAWNEKTARHRLRADVGHRHRTVVNDKTGKSAETGFRVIRRWPEYALLEASPVTGRPHQIRAHAAALGHPILGDALYGAAETDLIARPALHARTLAFTHPMTNQGASFSVQYPADFDEALKKL